MTVSKELDNMTCVSLKDETKFNEIVGRNLKQIRLSRNIDEKELANILKINIEKLHKIEAGNEVVNDYLNLGVVTAINRRVGKDITEEIFSGVRELYGEYFKLNDVEQRVISNLRKMPDDYQRGYIDFIAGWMAEGAYTVE